MSLFNLKDTLGGDDHLVGDFDNNQFYGGHNDSGFGGQDHSSAFGGFPGYGSHGLGQASRNGVMGGLSQQQQQVPAGFRATAANAPPGANANAGYPGLRLPANPNYNSQSLLGGAIGLGGIQAQQPPGVRMMAPGSGKPADEDFPALPGSSGSSKIDHSSSLSLNSASASGSIYGGMDMNPLGGDKTSSSASLSNNTIGAVGSLRGISISALHNSNTSAADPGPTPVPNSVLGASPQQPGGSSGLLANLGLAASSAPSTTTAMSKEMKFGLAGLLDIIRSTDKDSYALALGTDLTTFGLNLNANETLYPNFTSPLSEAGQNEDPQVKVPQCYMIHPPSVKLDQFSKFQVETLFYMFYQLPKDILQALAAQELYKRDWRYHGELTMWLKPRSQQEMMQSHPNIQFVYFDTKAWETRPFNAPIRGNLVAGIIPEEEIRVKIPVPGQAPLVESS